MTPRTKTTKRRRIATKHTSPKHPCDRPDVRALVFAIGALERAKSDDLAFPGYLMHRRELSIRLGDALSPWDGGRVGASAMVRLDVQIHRELRDNLTALVAGRYPGELDDLVGRALDAGLKAIVPRLRRPSTMKMVEPL